MTAVAELERGRDAFAAQAWGRAYASLSAADLAEPLEARDLELLATSAYMLGRESEHRDLLERAHRAHLDRGEPLAAVRCAFWIGVGLASRGEVGRSGGWLARARRMLEEHGDDLVERGYLLLPVVFEREAAGDLEGAAQAAAEAAAVGRRHGDQDLFALAAHEQGHVLIRLGRSGEGLPLLDEAMVAVTAGELSPIVSGIVYCGVILACRDAFEVRRAQEWTEALSGFCERQPDLVAFTGRCLTHRAELMQLRGAWPEALEEARRAERRCAEGENPAAAGEACYRQGELHRLRGDAVAAEAAYREAARRGREPQPGLALLRLAQGRRDAAGAAVRRALAEAAEPGLRARLLPAWVEIVLAAGDLGAAREASDELASLARGHEEEALGAAAAQARGAVELAEGDPGAALASLRHAGEVWRRLEAAHEVARVRELVALACRALGDEETAGLELEAARAAYAGLGAGPDLARIGSLGRAAARGAHGLTERELQVLLLVAAGRTNRQIAAALVLSERTVDRHVGNIFAKLRVSSRAAATSYAYEHGLLRTAAG
ncbi:MAG TPA: helix-turn-helix transcriptional regulator [Gaiellaceae bacterium]|nr:helix-turn-helix transcriptional regulator [Gaiellaceae bacterium]